jgi:Ser/Thr protein kinase RdoA (MazF antagonist)
MPLDDELISGLDTTARQVAAAYGELRAPEAWQPMGGAGGFSGARLWRISRGGGVFALRAWPPGQPVPTPLAQIHGLMRRATAAGLDFVPRVLATDDGVTVQVAEGRLWDVVTWQPGTADFHANPSLPRLEAAATALAQLHRVWQAGTGMAKCSDGVNRWLERLAYWTPERINRLGADPRLRPERFHELIVDPRLRAEGALVFFSRRALDILINQREAVTARLAVWQGRPLPVQPIIGDVWHDHVLFSGHRVSGLIDYGGVRTDNVAFDLARLTGSLVRTTVPWRPVMMNAYRRIRPLGGEESEFADMLYDVGPIIGLMTWLRWLYVEGRQIANKDAVRQLAEFVERVGELSPR